MPYYGQQGPEEYYQQGSGFNPYTGRLDGGQLVMQFLNQLQSLKDQRQQRAWMEDDRARQLETQGLQSQKYKADLAASQREASAWRSPEQIAEQDRKQAEEAHQRQVELKNLEHMNRLKEIELGAKKQEGVEDRAAKAIEARATSEYRKARASIESKYNEATRKAEDDYRVSIKSATGNPKLRETPDPTMPSPYQSSLSRAMKAKQAAVSMAQQQKEMELAELDEIYSEYIPGLKKKGTTSAQANDLTNFQVNPQTGERIGWSPSQNKWVPAPIK